MPCNASLLANPSIHSRVHSHELPGRLNCIGTALARARTGGSAERFSCASGPRAAPAGAGRGRGRRGSEHAAGRCVCCSQKQSHTMPFMS